MKSLYRIVILACVAAISASSWGQIYKMEAAEADENYRRLLKVGLDALEDKQLKKDPVVYYYIAQAYVNLSEDPVYTAKNEGSVKLAVKYMLKGIKRDDNKSELNAGFTEVWQQVVEAQNKEALEQYNINKMAKSAKLFGLSYRLDSNNRYAYNMQGKSLVAYGDTVVGEVNYKNLIQWYNEDLEADVKRDDESLDPFLYFIEKYWKANKYDSAKLVLVNGREHFGADAKLNYFHKVVTLDQIKNMPPSKLMLDYVQEVLRYDKDDKELLHKENSIYIYLLKGKVNANNTAETDTMLNAFVREKVAKSSLKQSKKIKETDIFVDTKPENVLWKLAEYFQANSHLNSAKYVLDKYIFTTSKSFSDSDIAARWGIITSYAYDTKGLPYSGFVLQQAISKYPTNTELKELRKKIITEKEVVSTSVEEQGALYLLMQDEYEANTDKESLDRLLSINDKYLGLLVSKNRFSTAKDVMKERMKLAPAVDHSDQLKFIAKEDFYQNYFNTRTKGVDMNGKPIKAYKWNGQVGSCDPGTIDLDVQNKVANRINYFRRNAGVPEVLFDEATNEFCQKAALMMTSNGKMEHNPPRTWRCWTNDGNYAAKHSLIIKDANTSMAVTYIMDDKNPSAGNRRWLLYPNGKVYGHGSTDDIAVIWALDDSGSADTTLYMDNPITWPPQGHVPQIMMFNNWTFSIYRDLENATVEVKQDGKSLEVQVEKFVRGYGAPTLVFQPKVNKDVLPEKSNFDVTVTLSNGRKYSYTVHTFFYNPSW